VSQLQRFLSQRNELQAQENCDLYEGASPATGPNLRVREPVEKSQGEAKKKKKGKP
jgi:hypothetical protein